MSTFKRCGCSEVGDDGKRRQLGSKCPKLKRADGSWNPRHGTWAYSASVTRDGKRKQVTKGGFSSQDAARQAESDLLGKAREGVDVASGDARLSVAGWLDRWLASKADIKRSTWVCYRQHVETYLKPALGSRQLDGLRVDHVAKCLGDLNVSAATKQRIRGTLRAALADAMRQRLVSVNVAALVKLASGKRAKALVWTDERVKAWKRTGEKPSRVMVWTAAQTGAFLDVAASDRLYALYHVLAYRGLRRGEVCGLRWADVDLDGGKLAVRSGRVQVGWEVVEDDPKSEASADTVALDGETCRVLRAWRKRQAQERLAAGAEWTDSGYVFTRSDGSALHPAEVSEHFRELARAAGLPPVRLHDLRHGTASLMRAAGASMKQIQHTLRHSSQALTADTYTSVFEEADAEAAEGVAQVVPRKRREGAR